MLYLLPVCAVKRSKMLQITVLKSLKERKSALNDHRKHWLCLWNLDGACNSPKVLKFVCKSPVSKHSSPRYMQSDFKPTCVHAAFGVHSNELPQASKHSHKVWLISILASFIPDLQAWLLTPPQASNASGRTACYTITAHLRSETGPTRWQHPPTALTIAAGPCCCNFDTWDEGRWVTLEYKTEMGWYNSFHCELKR